MEGYVLGRSRSATLLDMLICTAAIESSRDQTHLLHKDSLYTTREYVLILVNDLSDDGQGNK